MRVLSAILVFVALSTSAKTELDSLKGVWDDRSFPDTVRIEAYSNYIRKGFLHANPDSAFKLCLVMEEFARKIDRPDWIAEADYMKGTTFFYKGDFTAALPLFKEALKLWEKDGDIMKVGTANNGLAVIHSQLGNHDQAISYYMKALKIREAEGDSLGVSSILNNIGLLYKEQEQYDRSVELFNRALKLAENLGNDTRLGTTLENLGILYSVKGELDSATSYFKQALIYKYKMNDVRSIASSLLNIGGNYVKLGEIDSAEAYLNKSLQISRERGLKVSELSALGNLGELYKTRGETSKAIDYVEQAHAIATGLGALDKQRSTSKMLSELYKGAGRYEDALKMYELYVTTRDSLLSEQNQREILRQEYKYEYEKEALTDSLEFAKKEAVMVEHSEKQRLGLVAAGGGLVLLIALAFAIYRGKKRSDELLLNILPEETAQELKEKGHSDAQLIEHVTVLFTDFKGFTALSEKVTPKELVKDLHECFSAFDNICGKYGIEKIKTIGDAYMAAGGLPSPNTTHAQDVVKAALEMREFVEKGKRDKVAKGLPFFEIRIGVHTGPVVAGIVGVKKFQYDIWGDTVNTASRMESSGEAGKVNISQTTYELVKDQFTCEYRGEVEAKGKGKLKMYFVEKL
ncbi:MAG: tetratricopeptide repeat protein [Flavobacteriales bacterium]|nr:tetratricopeptide repeat protein [Flavobacteriales bacterium]